MSLNRFSTIAVLLLLVLSQSGAMFLASANNQSGTIILFSNSSASASISLTEDTYDTSITIEMPRNVTIQSAQFVIEAKDELLSPGQLHLDIGNDGIKEWAFEGSGFGDLGHQNVFSNNQSHQAVFSSGVAQSSPFYVPFNAQIDSTEMDITYTSNVLAGFVQVGQVHAYKSGDLDNDSRMEVVVLSKASSTTGYTSALSLIDWTSSGGLTTSSWVATCGNAEDISLADIDGDGLDDVVVSAPTDNMVCVHFTNASTNALGAAQPVTLTSNLIDASVGDFNDDGEADIVSIHAGGTFSMRAYNQKVGSFGANVTATVYANNTQTPSQISSMVAGHFNGIQDPFSVVVFDIDGHSTHLSWLNAGIAESIYPFDGMGSNTIVGDIDSDGDLDFIASTMQGSTIAENNGTGWQTTSLQTIIDFNNASVFDHDGDGVASLITPLPSSSDGNLATVEGNLTVYDVNMTSITTTQTILQPWSNPSDVLGVDFDGDGLLEHVVSAGEGPYGLFIGSWNEISVDLNQDGQSDLSQQGYAGDGSSGTAALSVQDLLGMTATLLSPRTSSSGFTQFDYDIQMSEISFDFTSSGHGTFNVSNLDIGYDFDFTVENNPYSSGNLSNGMNQLQTAGTGTIAVPLPFKSTKNGTLSVSNLFADYLPGAPNLSLPPTPELSLEQLSFELVAFGWQDVIEFGDDFVEFEVFRTTTGAEFDFTNPFTVSGANMTIDSEITPGQSYDYAVRSLHEHGVTSNLSVRLSLTIPFPAPPSAVTGLNAIDTPNDNGSSLDVSWNASLNSVVQYSLFIDTQPIQSVFNLSSVSNFASPFTEQMSTNITALPDQSPLVDRTDYWIAVVGYDGYGNSSLTVSSVGPIQTQNNSLRTAQLTVEFLTSGFSNETTFVMSALDSLSLNVSLSSDGSAIASQPLDLRFEAEGFTYPISGVTDQNGMWNAIEVDDLTELSAAFSDFVGEVTLSVDYDGTAGTPNIQPTDAASFSFTGFGVIRVDATYADQSLQLNQTSYYEASVVLTPELVSQNSNLANAQFNWQLIDEFGNVSESGTVEYKGGSLSLTGVASQNDTLQIVLSDNQPWLSISPSSSYSFTFRPYLDGQSDNDSENQTENETNQPPFPDVTLADSMSCEAVTYAWEENSTDSPMICTVFNPNPFEVQLAFTWAVIPATPPPLSFEPDPLPSSGPILTMNANETLEVTFTPIRNGPSDGLFPGLQGVGYQLTLTCLDDGTGRCSTMTTSSATVAGELQWTLAQQLVIQNDDEGVDQPDSTSSGSAGLVIGIVAFVLIAIAVGAFVLLRPQEEEDDEWFEEFDEEEPSAPIMNPSKSLEQLKSDGTTMDDVEIPSDRRPSLFDEVDNRVSYPGDVSEEVHEEQHDSEENSDDDGITTDEEGTEWWEDEEGVWWYREDGWEDWAVWED